MDIYQRWMNCYSTSIDLMNAVVVGEQFSGLVKFLLRSHTALSPVQDRVGNTYKSRVCHVHSRSLFSTTLLRLRRSLITCNQLNP
jgi:hypothetical protein